MFQDGTEGAGALQMPLWWNRGESPMKIANEFQVDIAMAARLRSARSEERRLLYATSYEEVVRRNFGDLESRLVNTRERERRVEATVRALGRFIRRDTSLVEIGPGDGRVAIELAPRVKRVVLIDVRDTLQACIEQIPNVDLVVTDGCGAPLPSGAFDLAFSDQLIEHLHPDDALQIHRDLFRALAPGGAYVCLTPNRLLGPHDLTRYYGRPAPMALHLREYTFSELAAFLHDVGFVGVKPLAGGGRFWLAVPPATVKGLERRLDAMTPAERTALLARPAMRRVMNIMLGVRAVAYKPR